MVTYSLPSSASSGRVPTTGQQAELGHGAVPADGMIQCFLWLRMAYTCLMRLLVRCCFVNGVDADGLIIVDHGID